MENHKYFTKPQRITIYDGYNVKMSLLLGEKKTQDILRDPNMKDDLYSWGVGEIFHRCTIDLLGRLYSYDELLMAIEHLKMTRELPISHGKKHNNNFEINQFFLDFSGKFI